LFTGLKSLLLEDGGSFAVFEEEKETRRWREGEGIFVLIHNPTKATAQKRVPYTHPTPTMAIGVAHGIW
jgi:hypothetical protein